MFQYTSNFINSKNLSVMKKTTLLCLILFCISILNHAFAKSNGEPFVTDEPTRITTLIINSHATVILVNDDNATLQVTGNKSLAKLVTLKKTGDTLVIGSTRNRDLTEAITIYVPASQLRNIRINGEADVRTLNTLQVAKLDVVVNCDCSFSISNIGELNITGTEYYSVDYSTEVHRFPLIRYNNNREIIIKD